MISLYISAVVISKSIYYPLLPPCGQINCLFSLLYRRKKEIVQVQRQTKLYFGISLKRMRYSRFPPAETTGERFLSTYAADLRIDEARNHSVTEKEIEILSFMTIETKTWSNHFSHSLSERTNKTKVLQQINPSYSNVQNNTFLTLTVLCMLSRLLLCTAPSFDRLYPSGGQCDVHLQPHPLFGLIRLLR